MSRVLKARIGVARIAIADHVGQPTHSAVSGIQARALVSSIEPGMGAEQIAELSTMVVTVQWAPADLTLVLDALRGALPSDAAPRHRRAR